MSPSRALPCCCQPTATYVPVSTTNSGKSSRSRDASILALSLRNRESQLQLFPPIWQLASRLRPRRRWLARLIAFLRQATVSSAGDEARQRHLERKQVRFRARVTERKEILSEQWNGRKASLSDQPSYWLTGAAQESQPNNKIYLRSEQPMELLMDVYNRFVLFRWVIGSEEWLYFKGYCRTPPRVTSVEMGGCINLIKQINLCCTSENKLVFLIE